MHADVSRPASRLAEVLLGCYLFALVYGTLYPWTGWRATGLPSLGFLAEPWPRWWTWLDVLVNVAIYLPVGALTSRLVAGQRRWPLALLAGLLLGSLASMLLEALQGYLPGRVASRLDWVANAAGAALGALLGTACSRLRCARAPDWQRASLGGYASALGVALLLTWLAIQLPPQRVAFGNGDLLEPLSAALGGLLGPLLATLDPSLSPDQAAGWLQEQAGRLRLDTVHSVLVEACGTATAVAGIGLLVRELCPAAAPRTGITAGLLLAATAARSVSAGLLLGPGQTFAWLSAGAQGGLLLGVVLLTILASGRRRARLRWAIAAIAMTALLTSFFPADPYHASMLQLWDKGAWRNFDGLLEAAALVWPCAAIVWCAARLRALRPPLSTTLRNPP